MANLALVLSEFMITSAPLSNAGMLILLDSEVEVKCGGNVSVVEHLKKKVTRELIPAGLIVLTNLRIVSISNKIGWGFNLADVGLVEDCASSYFGQSTRLNFQMNKKDYHVGLKFQSNGKDKSEFLTQTQVFLAKKSWLTTKNIVSKMQEPDKFCASNAGVAGILRRQELNLKSVDALARDAMVDLDSLMMRAKEIALVVQRYASYAGERTEGGDGERSETSSEAGEVTEIDSILQSMGIASPVTKFSAGRLYHKQLARQLADFLHDSNRLSRLGGMMTLTDVYGMFNRARGTELVSPDDFLQSAQMLKSLNVSISCIRFPSGVCMLRLDSLSEDYLCKSLVELSQSTNPEIIADGIQASLVAQTLNLSIVLAKEILLVAESRGLLCRDDSICGLTFFYNSFN